MNDREIVEFVQPAQKQLPTSLQDRLRSELKAIFAGAKPNSITVSRSFVGYAPNVENSVVLGVGLRLADSFESHIVKIGARRKVEADWTGWRDCTANKDVSSRIFHPVSPFEQLPDDRYAVLYKDAYMLFGGYERNHVETLEKVAEWAVKDDGPEPQSVERVIENIFTDLGRWFYYDAKTDPEQTREQTRTFLESKLHPSGETPVIERWNSSVRDERPDPVHLRRDAIWLLCGSERPENLKDSEASYLDPVDYLDWAFREGKIPDAVVGRAHGDLHGRNILLTARLDPSVLASSWAKIAGKLSQCENTSSIEVLDFLLPEPTQQAEVVGVPRLIMAA